MKVGDKVVRFVELDNRQWLYECNHSAIEPDSTLTIKYVDGLCISFAGLNRTWSADKFKLVGVVSEASTRCLCCNEDDRYPCTCGGRGKPKPSNAVTAPAHYQFFPDLEAIEVIASSLTAAEFRGYCLGNRLKYRLRAGNKDKLEQDIKKSDYYVELYEKHKHLCKAS